MIFILCQIFLNYTKLKLQLFLFYKKLTTLEQVQGLYASHSVTHQFGIQLTVYNLLMADHQATKFCLEHFRHVYDVSYSQNLESIY